MAERGEDLAVYWAREMRRKYCLSRRAKYAELEAAAHDEGAPVVLGHSIYGVPAVYIATPRGCLIVVRPNAEAWHIAHELLHHLIRETGRVQVTAYTSNPRTEEERLARRFEQLLCGSYAEWVLDRDLE